MSRYEKHVTTRPCHVRKKKMLQLTHLICIIRSTRYLDDKTCHFFSNKSMSQDILANVPWRDGKRITWVCDDVHRGIYKKVFLVSI